MRIIGKLNTVQDIPLQNTYCVTRVEGIASGLGTRHLHWSASIKRHRRTYARHFADSLYGGQESAWLRAVAYRDAVMRLFPPHTQLTQRTMLRSNNTSGIAGVSAKRINGRLIAWTATLSTASLSGMPDEHARLRLLNAWFDAVRPQFMRLRLKVVFQGSKGCDCLYLVAGNESRPGQLRRKAWTIKRRTHQQVLRIAWDYARSTLTEQFGEEGWQEFSRLHQAAVLSSDPQQLLLIRHRHEPPGHTVLRHTPPAELKPMLREWHIPPLAPQDNPRA